MKSHEEEFERLIQDKSKLVFWKREILIKGIPTKAWTTSTGYLIKDKFFEIGTDKLLCTSWIDEDYLNEIEKNEGKNIIVFEE